jgi:hypothetical protein
LGVPGVGAQHRDLTPGRPVRSTAEPSISAHRHAAAGIHEQLPGQDDRRSAYLGAGRLVDAQAEGVEPAAATVRLHELVGPLVEHLDSQAVQHRQHGGQRHATPVEEEPQLHLDVDRARLDREPELRLFPQRPDHPEIGQCLDRVDIALVRLGDTGELVDDVPVARTRRVEHPLVPRECGGELALQAVLVGPEARRRGHSEVHTPARLAADPGRVLDPPSAQLVQQHLLHRPPCRVGGGLVADGQGRRRTAGGPRPTKRRKRRGWVSAGTP